VVHAMMKPLAHNNIALEIALESAYRQLRRAYRTPCVIWIRRTVFDNKGNVISGTQRQMGCSTRRRCGSVLTVNSGTRLLLSLDNGLGSERTAKSVRRWVKGSKMG
jgi:hypothetical protein